MIVYRRKTSGLRQYTARRAQCVGVYWSNKRDEAR